MICTYVPDPAADTLYANDTTAFVSDLGDLVREVNQELELV